ncbi:Oidioi.mRNA.OKI2018_I69.chr1.g1885.t1.cds [Oikopleura dioica]|uniref:Oidioi.mRNA.OKI2018_I69.chr1.g1885.t1.cds n=1 Tax=Oikopleura dioica TaxID=34765 RepID=A0ABN7SSS4_OIKDI|nr:Oidioi.mRNA.OKI2018_I69.chr1.g1885.t1.cds [Oikopleura dioica]
MDEVTRDMTMPSYVTPNGHQFFFGPVHKGQFYREHYGQIYWNPFFEIFFYRNDEKGEQTNQLVKMRIILQSSVADPYSINVNDIVDFDPKEFTQSRALLLRDITAAVNEPQFGEVARNVILVFHEDHYQHLLSEGLPNHQITGLDEHLPEPMAEGPTKAMLRQEFPFIKDLVHTVCTRRKAWKLFDPLCEVDESYAFLKYDFSRRTTHKTPGKFKKVLSEIIDNHFTVDFRATKPTTMVIIG